MDFITEGRKRRQSGLYILTIFLVFYSFEVPAMEPWVCLMDSLVSADEKATVGDIKALCLNEQGAGDLEGIDESSINVLTSRGSLLEKRQVLESLSAKNPYVLLPYRPNYAVFSYTAHPNESPYRLQDASHIGLEKQELEFQLSLRFMLVDQAFDNRLDVFFSFTMHAFWQAFNEEISAPFRETNYEPELVVSFNNNWQIGGFTNAMNFLSLNHQSNGQVQPLSRSWNRLIAGTVWEKDNYVMAISPWYRFKEDEKPAPGSAKGDDNPDINYYLGYFEWLQVLKKGSGTFSLALLNNCRTDDNKTTMTLTYSYPVHKKLRIYSRYFNGYGRSLIDYNKRQQTFSLGFALNDWL